MYYPEQVTLLHKLMEEITSLKEERETYAANFHDVPSLKTIEQILEERRDDEQETLLVAYEGYLYLAEQYTSMCRFSIAASYREKALCLAIEILDKHGIIVEHAEQLLSDLLRDRNFYVDDDCEDIMDLLAKHPLIDETRAKDIHQRRMNRRRGLNNDPVEMSKEYLNVIDEVEAQIEQERTMHGMGSCYEIWTIKQRLLAERGIIWHTPHDLNPRVMFD